MRVALFKTCVVDLMRYQTIEAAQHLLVQAGFTVEIPSSQTCCGQVAFNGGDRQGAKKTLLHLATKLQDYDAIVFPSGSCAAMVIRHGDQLFETPQHKKLGEALSKRCYELCDFLIRFVPKNKRKKLFQTLAGETTHKEIITVGYHHSCSGLRDLGIYTQPRTLLAERPDVKVKDLDATFRCCGFGGLFSVKHPDISARMADTLIQRMHDLGVKTICGGDWGCLLHLQGRLSRQNIKIRVHHIVDVLTYGLPAS